MKYKIIKLKQHELDDYKGEIIQVLDHCAYIKGLTYDDDQPSEYILICLVKESGEQR